MDYMGVGLDNFYYTTCLWLRDLHVENNRETYQQVTSFHQVAWENYKHWAMGETKQRPLGSDHKSKNGSE